MDAAGQGEPDWPGRRRRARAVVVVLGVLLAVLAGRALLGAGEAGKQHKREDPADRGWADPSDLSPAPSGLRTESWAGLSVDVPAAWGYGGAPGRFGGIAACYPNAAVSAAGQGIVDADPTLGWVGRPVFLTDICALYPWIEYSPQLRPEAPYVWLGAAVQPGVVHYDNGYVQETIEAHGTTLTVASDDPALRARVLASVRAEQGCAAYLDAVPAGEPGIAATARGDSRTARLCAYHRDGDRWVLATARDLTQAAAEAVFAAVEGAPTSRIDCDASPGDLVLLRARYAERSGGAARERRAVFDLTCGGVVDLGDGAPRQLVVAAVRPWADGSVRTSIRFDPGVGGRASSWFSRYFIGQQG